MTYLVSTKVGGDVTINGGEHLAPDLTGKQMSISYLVLTKAGSGVIRTNGDEHLDPDLTGELINEIPCQD